MKKGTVYAVGVGPGNAEAMTGEAAAALTRADEIYGYTLYIDLLRPHFPGKTFVTTGMRQETERCRLALSAASEGKTVAVVCSGDAGVYGMAGLLLELSEDYPNVLIEVVPGVTAALSGAALLGAPLAHDFCVISLSDLLTPWELIEKRLRLAAEAELLLCLYNPASKKRKDYLARACAIVREYRSADTVCGYVKNIGRESTEQRVLSLAELSEIEADMTTTVFIGTSDTIELNGRMVTRRGYSARKEA